MNLTNQQQKAKNMDFEKPCLIKGCAGSGKSLIALHRAKAILEDNSLFARKNVIIFTYNKTLVTYLKNLSKDIIKENDLKNLLIINFHKWAFNFLTRKMHKHFTKRIDENENKELVKEIKNKLYPEEKQLTSAFVYDEIYLIKENNLSEDSYFEFKTKRSQHISRFTADDKQKVWRIYLHYVEEQKRRNIFDFSDFGKIIFEKLTKSNGNNNYGYEDTYILVDEVQDFTKLQLLVLNKLFRNRITLLGDVAQRIYKTGYTWKSAGLQINSGNSITLSQNFRNPYSVFNCAKKLIEPISEDEEILIPEIYNNIDSRPEILVGKNFLLQLENAIQKIKLALENKEKVALIHRSNSGVKKIIDFLNSNNINAIDLRSKKDYFRNDEVVVTTMHSAKGLEFDRVFLVDIKSSIFEKAFASNNNSNIERNILFTAITRTKKNLYLCTNNRSFNFFKSLIFENQYKFNVA